MSDLKPGLLIASPQMRDPNFERTVVAVCQHDANGALGLVINRDGPVPLSAVVARMSLEDTGLIQAPHLSGPTWWGGPVGSSTGFVLWRGVAGSSEGWNVGDDIAVSPSAARLGKLVASGEPFRLCLGYAGWGPGQLGFEISLGTWLYADIDADILFDTPVEERYERALALLGLRPELVWMRPINE